MPTTLTVDGMSCEHCEARVEEALEALDGVAAASANHVSGTVTVEGDVDVSRAAEAVDDAGYELSA